MVDVLSSALRHGISPDDAVHAIANAMALDEIGEDPTRYLVLGPARDGAILEVVVMDRPQGPAVIHAMAMRAKYRALLERGR